MVKNHLYYNAVDVKYSVIVKDVYFCFLHTLKFQIYGTPRLLIIPFFATLPNLIQHSPFINFGEFCQSPLLFQTPRLLIHVRSRQR